MFYARTDLAYEANEQYMKQHAPKGRVDGIVQTETRFSGGYVNRIEITNENGSNALKRPIGNYITVHADNIQYDNSVFERVSKKIAEEIERLTSVSSEDTVLVAGLGNRDITPDALGHEVISHILVTNHLKHHHPGLLDGRFGTVCAIAPGVLGSTGIESGDIIRSVALKIKPSLVITVDALAAADLHRIASSFQICDTGIQPGAGVGNNRNEISESTIGTKVIAIGVPTMIDANNITGKNTADSYSMMVTPRDIDAVIKKSGLAIANGINLALHKNITLHEINEYVG